MDIFDVMVTLGSIGFIVCTVPQGWRTWKTRRADDFSWTFLVLVIASSALMLPPLIKDQTWPFAAAQLVNIIVWGLVLAFKLFPRGGRKVIANVEGAVADVVDAVKPEGTTTAGASAPTSRAASGATDAGKRPGSKGASKAGKAKGGAKARTKKA